MFKEGWPLAPLMKYISIHVCTHKKIIKMMFINAWWLKQSGSFGKKIMNKCNGTERNGRKDGFFARKACSVCVCSIHSFPFHSISFHFIRFHSVFPDKKWNGTEWNGMKWNEMEWNGKEWIRTNTHGAGLSNKETIFSSVPFRCICS